MLSLHSLGGQNSKKKRKEKEKDTKQQASVALSSFLLLVLCWTSLTGPFLSAGEGV
jgi:hypothetical protein